MMWTTLKTSVARRLFARTARHRRGAMAAHLESGERGELEALFYLRQAGYVVVARRWRTTRLRGDVDVIGWDGETLCFVEVKTRATRDAADALVAVDEDKRDMLRRMARAYLRTFPVQIRDLIPVRFDVVSVYLTANVEFELYKEAFGW